MSKVFKSCFECNINCCRVGPGPYKTLPAKKFLENYCNLESYNTKCDGLMKNRKCRYWGTNKLPYECRVYICPVKRFTKKERDLIENIIEYKCENCGAKYMVHKTDKRYYCEVCNKYIIYINFIRDKHNYE